MKIEDIGIAELKNLKEDYKNLSDPRVQKRSTYKIWDVITTSTLAIMANADTFEEIKAFADEKYLFLKSFLQMTGGVPSSLTYENIIGLVNPKELQRIAYESISQMVHQGIKGDIINIDGKVDTSSKRYNDKPLNVLNAYSNKLGVFLYGVAIEDKTNEIPMFKEVLKGINVKGNIITVDALNTQKDNASLVRSLKGDYVFAVKGNHDNLYTDIVDYFNDEEFCNSCKSLRQTSKENSSVIVREYYQTNNISWLEERREWQGLKTIGCIKKTTTNINTGEVSTETRYYISSLDVDLTLFSDAVRGHWSVENKLHWHLDFTFKCDDNTTNKKSALENLQILKKIVLNLLSLVKDYYKKSLIKIRYYTSLNAEKYIPQIFNLVSKMKKQAGFSLADALKIPCIT